MACAIAISSLFVSNAFAADTLSLMEEVIVTADKRSESIQDVSASITALNSEMIARAGIEDVTVSYTHLTLPTMRTV